MWLSLVERCVRDAKAAGSNPVIPTISSVHNQLEGWKWTLDFLLSVNRTNQPENNQHIGHERQGWLVQSHQKQCYLQI